MILKFIDREKELEVLNKTKSNVILIYGRRRIGKTRLIKEFIKDKKAFYFLCQKNKLDVEFERFLRKFNKTFSTYIEANDLEEFFEKIKNQDLIIVFDEFSYWVEKNPEVPSLFQYIIDEILKNSRLKIILSGSLIGTMESLLSYKQPLYGRIKQKIKLSPLKFKYVPSFLPKYDIETCIKVYSCVGEIPAYIQEFNDSMDFEKNLNILFFNKFGFFYDEAERLLKDELREPNIYFRIIEAMALGHTRLGKIASKAYIDITNLPKYLKVLEQMEIIEKITPVVGKDKLYVIKDKYFRFWIEFVYAHREEIELETYKFPRGRFNQYLGKVFEDVCKEALLELRPINFNKIGKWWHKDREIDILALNESKKELLAVECKWKENIDPKRICRSLLEKLEHVNWYNKERKDYLTIFAKSFKEKINEFEGYKVFCYDLKDLEKYIKKRN